MELLTLTFAGLAFFYWLFQIVFSFLYWRKNKNKNPDVPGVGFSIILPVFNESPESIRQTVDSILAQNVKWELIIVDDGSDMPLIHIEHPQIHYFRQEKNQGKRKAQMLALTHARYDWIVTLDSDTIMATHALAELYWTAQKNNADAVCGTIYLSNEHKNMLTKMTAWMYWISFFQERASHSYFKVVNCCSGALSLYRKTILQSVSKEYVSQRFWGKECLAGDDRHLTSLFVLSNAKVVWSPSAKAYTTSPDTLARFLKQQMRWARSHVSEVFYLSSRFSEWPLIFGLINLKLIFKYVYILFVYMAAVATCMQMISIFPALSLINTVLIVVLLKTLLASAYTRTFHAFWLIPYAMFALFLLTPVLLYAVLTPWKTDWLTRKSEIQ